VRRLPPHPEERAWFEADRRLREKLTLRDIGICSHYVGDATQPLHATVHFNGWGDQHDGDPFAQGQKDQPDDDRAEIVGGRGPVGAPEAGSDDGKQSSNGEGHGGPEETIHPASIHEFAQSA
jgi:hypothetical protein